MRPETSHTCTTFNPDRDMDTLIRHWHILQQIPRHPRKVTAGRIHSFLQDTEAVSTLTKRTIERDLHFLARLFPLECDGCKPQGWCWRADAAVLDIPGMDLTAALTFRMLDEYLSRMLPQTCTTAIAPHLQRARAILGKPGHGGLSDWPEKVRIVPRTQPLLPPTIDQQVLETVYAALLRNCRFKGIYKRHDETGKELVINPLGLVFNDPIVYLVATCWDYTDVRSFALHRFTSADLTDTTATRPADFSLQKFIDDGAFGFASDLGATIRLKVRFTCEAAAHLLESRLSEDQTISDDKDGWVQVEATVADTPQLRWWLLAFGAQVEVMGPEALRKEFKISTNNAASLYYCNKSVGKKKGASLFQANGASEKQKTK